MGRTIVFGDVHGCHDEWRELLDSLAVGKEDRLIAVGDLVCKGPSSSRTLDLAMSLPNLTCVVGNHELRFLEAWRAGRKPDSKPHDILAAKEMGDRFDLYMRFVSRWPLYVDLPELLVVHAGLRPGVPLERQTAEDLTHLRRVGDEERPWYDFFVGSKPIAFGHWVRRKPLVLDHAIGLDTGCVYGGRLSAYVLPDRTIESVPARKAYSEKTGAWN